jgi:N-acetylmuramic acid 6-phosphate etherase
MHAPEKLIAAPPEIGKLELLKFQIGNENIAARTTTGNDAAVLLTVTDRATPEFLEAFAQTAKLFRKTAHLSLGGDNPGTFHVPFAIAPSPVELMEHMALKLLLNTISTGIMAKSGRVSSNWMSFVNVSNKKLLDRGIRLVAELGNISYQESCLAIFAAMEELEQKRRPGETAPSVVQHVLNGLRR